MTTLMKIDEQIISLTDTIARELRKVLELAKTKAASSDVTSSLALKADKSTTATKSELSEVASDVLLKADKSYVDTQLGSKVDALYVSNAIASKADVSVVNTKANASDVSSSLQEITADISELETSVSDLSSKKVSVEAQTLTETQQSQARTNIGLVQTFFNKAVDAYLTPIFKELILENGGTQAEIDAIESANQNQTS